MDLLSKALLRFSQRDVHRRIVIIKCHLVTFLSQISGKVSVMISGMFRLFQRIRKILASLRDGYVGLTSDNRVKVINCGFELIVHAFFELFPNVNRTHTSQNHV